MVSVRCAGGRLVDQEGMGLKRGQRLMLGSNEPLHHGSSSSGSCEQFSE